MASKSRNNTLGLKISASRLHRLCQSFAELLLLCLPQANKITCYIVGSVPHLMITRLGTAEKNQETNEIQWTASSKMNSDVSGKCWKDIRDCSTDALDALSSCLRNQTTWTVYGSKDAFRKEVEKSCENVLEKNFYFQPVLMRKADLWHSMPPPSVFPRDTDGKPIWLDSDYVTVALIKINLALDFNPLDEYYWQITEELTRALATKLLQLHSEKFYSQTFQKITDDNKELTQVLIAQIRQIMVKLSLINRVVDNELADLRQAWEDIIHEYHPNEPYKINIIEDLNQLLQKLIADHNVIDKPKTVKQLAWYQNKLGEFCFLPEENQVWFEQKILPLWKNTTYRFNSEPDLKRRIKQLLNQLEQSFYVGSNEKLIAKIDNIPNSIKIKWVNLAYNGKDLPKLDLLEKYTYLLREINIDIPNKRKTLENLVCLKNLTVYIQGLEDQLGKYIDKWKDNTQEDQRYLH